MKLLGNRVIDRIRPKPSAQALKAADQHLRTISALAAVNTTGIPCGVYRFRTHEDANRHADAALARTVAENLRARRAAR
ncbi:MAG: hypothetical protein HYU75_09675 [Betaproteobacteria bacterium]|nr:hypothetical protein [Betaproteobacteria bacterium]